MKNEIEMEEIKTSELENDIVVKVVEEKKIKDGLHDGQIIDLTVREFDFKGKKLEYVDFHVLIEDGFKLKHSVNLQRDRSNCPVMTMNNLLGRLVLDFGGSLSVGEGVSLKGTFLGKKCTILTQIGSRGYANIIKGSLKYRK